MRELRMGELFRHRMLGLRDTKGDPEDRRKAVLEVAIGLVTQARRGTEGS